MSFDDVMGTPFSSFTAFRASTTNASLSSFVVPNYLLVFELKMLTGMRLLVK